MNRGTCARAADLTGNGYLDLIIGGHGPSPRKGRMPPVGPHDSFVYIYWNGPEGISEQNRTILRADAVNCMAVADFNNDGMLDLFVGSYHNSKERDTDSFIYWNRAGIGFRESDCTRLFTHSASGAVAVDLNEDGWIDLAVANHKLWGSHKGYSEIWWNGPNGFKSNPTTRLPTYGPHGITSVEPGNIMNRGPEEYYISVPYKLSHGEFVSKVSWDAEIPDKTWVRLQLRYAPTQDELCQSKWQGKSSNEDWFQNGDSIEKNIKNYGWVQYRLALGAKNALRTPRVSSVRIYIQEDDT